MNGKLDRQIFEAPITIDYFSEKELSKKIGFQRDQWPAATIKEVIDNSLDACEAEKIDPRIDITIRDDLVIITDNGPGILQEIVKKSADYSVRVSNKIFYISQQADSRVTL